MTISKLSADFLRFFLSRGASRRSAETYAAVHARFVSYLVEVAGLTDDIKHFTPDTVEAFASRETERGCKAATVGLSLAALGALGQYGMRTKDSKGRYLLAENPLSRVWRPKRQRPAEKYLTLEELRRLATAPASPAERLALDVLIDTGLRASEVATANVGDLRLDGERTVLVVKVKGGRFHEVLLDPELAARLCEGLRQREAKPTEPLLLSARGERYTRTTLSEMVLRVAVRAGLTRFPVRAHVIRHSVATLAHAAGADVGTVAALLNHSGLETAQRYVHRKDAVDAARTAVRKALKGEPE